MYNIQRLLKKHSTLILTIIASGGVITTTVLAVKATPKALRLLEEAKEEKGEELTNLEKIKYGWYPYIGCIISGLSTITCIICINYISKKNQASLISAYSLLENSYNEYRNHIKNLYSDDADFLARQEIVRAKYDPHYEVGDKQLFFDYQSMRFFESTMDNVVMAEHQALEVLQARGYLRLNEYYDMLGIPRTDYGYTIGWADIESCDPYDVKELTFNYEKIYVGDNKDIECWVISYNVPPTFDYII
jgi:hypothetical protein